MSKRQAKAGGATILVVGGLGTPISRYFPGIPHFMPGIQYSRLVRAVEGCNGPVKIVGFSYGARRAIEMLRYPNVVEIHAHSPGGPIQFPKETKAKIVIYRTEGDRLTFESSGEAFEKLKSIGADVTLRTLKCNPGVSCHQFGNAIHEINVALGLNANEIS